MIDINKTELTAWITNTSPTINNIQILISFSIFFFLFHFIKCSLIRFSKTCQNMDMQMINKIVTRIISSIHAVLVTALSLKILYCDNELSLNKTMYSSFEISLTLNIVIGYMTYDNIIMLTQKDMFDRESILHHTVSIIAFYASTMLGIFPYIALFRLTSEASTLFINNRWLMLSFGGWKDTNLFIANGLCILFVFFLVRIVTIPSIWCVFYTEIGTHAWQSIHLIYKMICVATSLPLDILNVYWYGKIIKGVAKMFQSKKSKEGSSKRNNYKEKLADIMEVSKEVKCE